MNIGIDIDNTINRFPAIFKELMSEWILSGFKIFIITGNKNNDMPKRARLKQLKLLGITPQYYTELCIASGYSNNLVAYKKGIIAYQKKLDIFIDDKKENCIHVRSRLKNCLILFSGDFLTVDKS
jgi:hypothetical protein